METENYFLFDFILNPNITIPINKRIETIGTWELKCKEYQTTTTSCRCKSFQYRQWCSHQKYKIWKEELMQGKYIKEKNDILKSIKENPDQLFTYNKFNEDVINQMLKRGELLEKNNNHSQIFIIP